MKWARATLISQWDLFICSFRVRRAFEFSYIPKRRWQSIKNYLKQAIQFQNNWSKLYFKGIQWKESTNFRTPIKSSVNSISIWNYERITCNEYCRMKTNVTKRIDRNGWSSLSSCFLKVYSQRLIHLNWNLIHINWNCIASFSFIRSKSSLNVEI